MYEDTFIIFLWKMTKMNHWNEAYTILDVFYI